MKTSGITLLFLLPLAALSQNLPPIASGKYSWKLPVEKEGRNLTTASIFKGSSTDLEYLQVDACSLAPAKMKTSLEVPDNEEYLLIIKSGSMALSFGNSDGVIGKGSVCILVPGEKLTVQTSGGDACNFYLMKYRSKTGLTPPKESPASFVTDWNSLEFKPHDKGGVRKYFETDTRMFHRLEMHVTTLNDGLKSHEPHTHRPAEIILVMDDEPGQKSKTEMLIGDQSFPGEAGDLYYVSSNILHGIRNTGTAPCSYFAFQFD